MINVMDHSICKNFINALLNISHFMSSDRITEDMDWKDGMNSFRQYARREIELLKKEIEHLKKERSNLIGKHVFHLFVSGLQ